MIKRSLILILFFPALISCNKKEKTADASGNFEVIETVISAEATGTIKEFNIQEGQALQAGQFIGYIDSMQLYLKKEQLAAQINSTLSQRPNIPVQLASLQEQLKAALREQKRFENLVRGEAATQKQLDDINTQVDVIKRQIEAQRSALGITSESLNKQTTSLEVQIWQTEDQLAKCRLINPLTGVVLTKYVEQNEMAVPGKALYKIANMDTMNLRAYVTGTQLPLIKLGQQVKVLVDDGNKGYKEYPGTISWVSDKSEFTPKTIQTKDERANLVYAMKVRVKNDGYLKIGMYGQVAFN